MAVDTFATFAKRLERVQYDLSDDGFQAQLARVGRKLADEVDNAVRRDIGDLSMSGWWRGKPIELMGRSNVTDQGHIEITPAKRAAGPMRVLTDGRQAYSAGDRRTSGSRVSKKTGERVAKTRKVKRNVGATRGKGTWTDAESAIYDKASPMLHDEELRVLARWFG